LPNTVTLYGGIGNGLNGQVEWFNANANSLEKKHLQLSEVIAEIKRVLSP